MRRRTKLLLATMVLLGAPAGAPGPAGRAEAIPAYAARYEQNCTLCHFNPTGGGLRSTYASQFLVPTEMATFRYSQDRLAAIDPQLSESITLGFDLRTIHHASDRPKSRESTYEKNFFQMQGDLYLGVQMSEKMAAYVRKGLSASTPEVWGEAAILPWNGYAKVGRFLPVYGWKFDDHTFYTREKLGWGPAGRGGSTGNTDVGVELGMFPGRLALTAAMLNGNPGSISDVNNQAAFAAQGIGRWHWGGLGFGLGGSFWRNRDAQDLRRLMGPMGYVKWKGLTWVAEADWSRREPNDGTGRIREWVTSQELGCRVAPGLEYFFTFNFYDPDLERKSGTEARYGVGTRLMPYPFLVVSATLNFYRFDEGPAVTGDDYVQSEIQFHFFY